MQGRASTSIAAVTLTAALLSACDGSQNVTTTPETTATTPTSQTPTKSPSARPSPTTASIGDTITLHGQNQGEQLAATLKGWVDPAKSSDEVFSPEPGKRWVAGQFALRNTGTVTYSDSPANGAQVADTAGQRFGSTVTTGISAGPEMTSDLKLPVGETALGWIVFEVPTDSKIKTVQYTMDSGFAEQTGQWSVS